MYDIMNEFSLDPVEGFVNTAFFEFCHSIDAIEEYRESTELYLEAVTSPKTTLRGRLANDFHATATTTANTAKAANAIIDAKAGIISASVNLIFTLFGYAGKLLGYLSGKVADTINGTTIMVENIGKIPANVRATIKGDIRLYLTIGDIQNVYNREIINQLDAAIAELDVFTKGEAWGRAFHKNKVQKGVFTISSDDLKHARKIKSYTAALKNVRFSQSIVRMDVEKNREAYFSDKKVIKFKDLHGNVHDDTYVQAIGQLLSDLSERKNAINSLQSAFGEKKTKTELNGEWASLNKNLQEYISGVMQDVSVILSTIGNFVKYATIDLKTINDATSKITAKYSGTNGNANNKKKKK